MGSVYILKGYLGASNSPQYYIGSTKRSLDERLAEHMGGKSLFTSKLKRKSLKWACECDNNHVIAVEAYLKRNRQTAYQLAGKTESKFRFKRFMEWCEEHGIEVRNIRAFK